ncbi:MAG: hypothetical protein JSR62_07635 [Nitrospira sp.]|nr:hypothetical protein [Nitrospira sp.]
MRHETSAVTPVHNFPSEHPYWASLLLALATTPVFLSLTRPLAQQWAALLLALIGGAYVGFAAHDGRPHASHIELAGALAFAALGLAGLQYHPLWIVLGDMGHGCWDLLHHHPGP